jgi:hypothetical protein
MAAILALLLAAAGGAGFALSGAGSGGDAGPATASPTRGALTGVLTDVRHDRLTLAPEGGGETEVFGVRPIDQRRLDLSHLEEHVEQVWPVVLHFDTVDGVRYATRVDDA